MSARHNRINPDLMEALQMLKFSLKRGICELNFTEGTSRNAQLEQLEEYNAEVYGIPADIQGYQETLAPADSDNNSDSDSDISDM